MRRQPSDRSEEKDKNQESPRPTMPSRPTMPQQPIMPQMPNIPQQPMMPQQPTVPMPPNMYYQPGTPYNPIYTPPYTNQPTVPSPGVDPYVDYEFEPGPPVTADRNYLQGYLRTVIGRYVKVEFLVGTNMLVDREGTLVDVGIDHISLREPETDDLLVADLYSIKFVRVYY